MNQSRRLPPLNALRAFEAAARHLSFTKAAEELHVTPGAISQQVKALEEYIGVVLFRRLNRALMLTDEAESALPALREGFDKLAEATNLMTSHETDTRLTVSAAPSFASKWLVPRLGDFQERHPENDVWVLADMELTDFVKENVDVAIRFGSGEYEGLHVEKLLTEHVIPVCSPALLDGPSAIKSPDDLSKHTLLHDNSPDNDESIPEWSMWLKAAGVEGIDGSRGLRFNQSSLVLEAAMSGRGVALAKSTLAADDISAGRLATPFDLSQPLEFAYYIACPRSKFVLPKVQNFMKWLHESAQG
jgi:LysR family glycine cleavage system transcriptional activator